MEKSEYALLRIYYRPKECHLILFYSHKLRIVALPGLLLVCLFLFIFFMCVCIFFLFPQLHCIHSKIESCSYVNPCYGNAVEQHVRNESTQSEAKLLRIETGKLINRFQLAKNTLRNEFYISISVSVRQSLIALYFSIYSFGAKFIDWGWHIVCVERAYVHVLQCPQAIFTYIYISPISRRTRAAHISPSSVVY